MNYILIFENEEGQKESVEIVGILQVFNKIKINLQRIKKNSFKITLIKNIGNFSTLK